MKVPFRQQASTYDCVPTTFINALNYLFHREETPPFVVNQVYRNCLDVEAARGTSSRAVQDMGYWLSTYSEPRYDSFAIKSKFIVGAQVHLRQNSKILKCINANGAALLCVHSSQSCWHYILGFGHDGDYLCCFDPHPRTKRFIKNDAVRFVEQTQHQEPNLIIRCDWLDRCFRKTKTPCDSKYIFGNHDDRECLLLNRI